MTKKDILRIPILESFRQQRLCPLCLLWVKDEAAYLQQVESNEMTASEAFREAVVRATGFCNRHMHLLYEVAFSGRAENGLGYATYARDIVAELEKTVRDLHAGDDSTAATRRGLIPRGSTPRHDGLFRTLDGSVRGKSICPICAFLLESDDRRVGVFLQMLADDPEFAGQFSASAGVCAPHLTSAARSLSGKRSLDPVRALLVGTELRNLKKIHRDLDERIRKYAWEFREEEISPEERNSQTQALQFIAGCEGLYCKTRKGPEPAI